MELTITTDDAGIVVQPEPIAIHDNAYVVKRGGKVMGKVSARYDFSDLPGRYHAMVLALLSKSTVILDAI